MKPINIFIVFSPLIIALIITYLINVRGWGIVLGYFIVLMMVISFLSMGLFIAYWLRGRDYDEAVLSRAWSTGGTGNYRVAVVIPIFNEPPRLVAETATISKAAVGDLGDVYVLDDSTREDIRRELVTMRSGLASRSSGEAVGGGLRPAPLMTGSGPLVRIMTTR
ncbi:hypothetical protein JCM16161A_15800 [Vulcanisaeta sp. JCM 16161]|uniref:hypothetical protein n=1 Tax=Vulcanisaeta sp. JCM 16161 TaxID=1295372 RepID=UPI0006D1A94B|nr:hypothetical protein [Vulcanisaeta sp. JCM 16161]